MFTDAERGAMIDDIAALPALAAQAVDGLDDAQLDTTYRDGGWTLRQVLHHLADSHINAYIRSRFFLTEEHPTLMAYDQDRWAALVDASTAPVEDSLILLGGLHHRWTQLLRSLAASDWSRTAHHPENGDMVLDDILRIYSFHGKHHVRQITEARKRNGW